MDMGYLFSLSSLSKSATETGLNASEIVLLVSGLVLVLGAIGEYIEEHDKLPRWTKWPFIAMVVVSLIGEFAGDAGVYFFSSHLQTISDGEYATLKTEAGAAVERAGKAVERAADADLKRVELQARIVRIFGSRELGKTRAEHIAMALSGLPNSVKVDVEVLAVGNPWNQTESEESSRFAKEIVAALTVTHLDVGSGSDSLKAL